MQKKDEMILSLFEERDVSALEMVQNSYGRLIKSVAFNVYRSDTVAEECLNDTLLVLWNTIPPKKPESVSAYALTVARRKAIDRIKADTAKKRRPPEIAEYSEMLDELGFVEDIADGIVEKMELGRVLSEFLRGQNKKNRELFMRRYFDVETISSISASMHMSENAVKMRLSRMRDALGKFMSEEGVR